jgi:methyl-accepting chemotaxis protein-1 (serine sensor receptor)
LRASKNNSNFPEGLPGMSFGNLQVRTRLLLMLVFVNALLLTAIGFGWHAIGRVNAQLERSVELQNKFEAATDRAHNAQVQFKVQVLAWKNIMLRGQDPEQFKYYEKAFHTASGKVQDHLSLALAAMQKLRLPVEPAAKAMAVHMELGAKYAEALQAFTSGASVDDSDKIVRKINSAATEQIDGLSKLIQERGDGIGDEIVKDSTAQKRRLELELLALSIVALLFSAGAGWALVVSISRPLKRATEIARSVASGNLTTKIDVSRKDEFGELLLSLRNMNDALAGIVHRVRENSQSVMTASTQIAAGNRDLSSRTEEQASSLEETAASIEEMTATVNQNAENSREANEFAASAAKVAERGGAAVEQVVRTMDDIQQRSRKIADIIGVIDSIAFQTNILALNAAVEAARAGEEGRGFAVVAAEVRNLARRSAEAAREIKTLITDSVERVNSGARLANDAGSTMVEVVASVTRVSGIIAEIARATREQSSGITQVNQAAGDLDKATQQNAALVEQSTAASESLMRMARAMAEAVETFQVDSRAPRPLDREPSRSAQPTATPRLPLLGAARPAGSAAPALRARAPAEEEWKEF